MKNGKSLDYIANGFHAANKIRNIQKSNLREERNSLIKPGSAETLRQMLEVIAQYSPDTYKEHLGATLEKVALYSDSYRNLKQHLNTTRQQGLNKDQLVKTLSLMKPVVDARHQVIIDKITKIYEILNS